MVLESLTKFQEESSITKEIPLHITKPVNPSNDGKFIQHFCLSTDILDYSKISVYYDFFRPHETKVFYDHLINCDADWVKIGHRESVYFSPYPYEYTGHSHAPQEPCHYIIKELMDRISASFECELNSVFLNRYVSGDSGIPWHQDNEPGLGPLPTIYSLSLGDARVFEIKEKTTRKVIKIDLFDGTLVIMKGAMQRQWYHRVPECDSTGTRLNLTFRLMHKVDK